MPPSPFKTPKVVCISLDHDGSCPSHPLQWLWDWAHHLVFQGWGGGWKHAFPNHQSQYEHTEHASRCNVGGKVEQEKGRYSIKLTEEELPSINTTELTPLSALVTTKSPILNVVKEFSPKYSPIPLRTSSNPPLAKALIESLWDASSAMSNQCISDYRGDKASIYHRTVSKLNIEQD